MALCALYHRLGSTLQLVTTPLVTILLLLKTHASITIQPCMTQQLMWPGEAVGCDEPDLRCMQVSVPNQQKDILCRGAYCHSHSPDPNNLCWKYHAAVHRQTWGPVGA